MKINRPKGDIIGWVRYGLIRDLDVGVCVSSAFSDNQCSEIYMAMECGHSDIIYDLLPTLHKLTAYEIYRTVDYRRTGRKE